MGNSYIIDRDGIAARLSSIELIAFVCCSIAFDGKIVESCELICLCYNYLHAAIVANVLLLLFIRILEILKF